MQVSKMSSPVVYSTHKLGLQAIDGGVREVLLETCSNVEQRRALIRRDICVVFYHHRHDITSYV